MKKAFSILSALVLASVLLTIQGKPAAAAAESRSTVVDTTTTPGTYVPSIVYVTTDWNIQHHWWAGVSNSVPMVDQYTKSAMRWGGCHLGYRCLHIREVSHGSVVGITFWSPDGWHTFIDVNPNYRGSTYWFQRVLFSHELGHAFYVLNHSNVCDTVMYKYIPCLNGALPPWRFTWSERVILARW